MLALVRLQGAQQGITRWGVLPPPQPLLLLPAWQEVAGTYLEVGELGESLFAARMWALIGSVTCVDSAMGSPVRWGVPHMDPKTSSRPQALGSLGCPYTTQAVPTHTLSPMAETEPKQEDFKGDHLSFHLKSSLPV